MDHLTLEDLENEVITFGDVHQGHTYTQAWADQEWVRFMTSRYRKSTKEAHMRFLRFVELKVEAMEAEMLQRPIQPMPKAKGYPKAAAKSHPRNSARTSPSAPNGANFDTLPNVISFDTTSLDGEGGMESENEMYETMITSLQAENRENVQALQARMLSMENALTRVINHLDTVTPNPN